MNILNKHAILTVETSTSAISESEIRPALHERIAQGRVDAHILRSEAFYRTLLRLKRAVRHWLGLQAPPPGQRLPRSIPRAADKQNQRYRCS